MAPSHIPRGDLHNGIVQQWDPSLHHSPASGTHTPHTPDHNHNGSTYSYANTNGNAGNCFRENGDDDDAGRPSSPPYTADDEAHFKDVELNRKIMKSVEENGITKPLGYKVSYHYNSTVEDMHFGRTHPMKPWRLTLAKHLILGYGLQYAVDTFEAQPAGKDQVRTFHDPDYVDFLSEVSPDTFAQLCRDPRYAKATPPKHDQDTVDLGPYNLSMSPSADCPVFADMSTYLFLYTGATLKATNALTTGQSDIAINWSGGLHHAHKAEASGFCYINDIVLSILDMLRVWPRVLYIDIDVHHGDGVEEAFQRQPRVMTLSFHRYGHYDDTGHKFFPGTGDISDIGLRNTVGEHFALNVPIASGIDDRQYNYLFTSIVSRAVDAFHPSAIVLQCGADSLGGDRLGQFNINIKQHAQCVAFCKALHLPLLLLGGGGYTARNVARAWCHETSIATSNHLPDSLPMDVIPRPQAFQGKQRGDGKLFPPFNRLHPNDCRDGELEGIVRRIEGELRWVARAPWVKMEQLPQQGRMEGIGEEIDGRRRREMERNPGGRGELR